MSAGNIAYLIMVLAGYAVFVLVLGVYWMRASFTRPKRHERPEVTSALGAPTQAGDRKTAG